MSKDVKFRISATDNTKAGINSAKSGIASIAGGFVVAQLAIEAMKKAYDASIGFMTTSAMTFARTETLGVALDRIGSNAGIASETLDATEESLKNLGITTQGARSIMSNLITAQIDLAEAGKLARTAQDFAVLSGENSTDVTMALTDAIVSNNTQMLKKYGIITTTNKVLDAYAGTIGKTADELTEAEKQQAFLNLVLEKGEAVAGLYDDAMGTAGKQMGSMARHVEELQNAVGEGLQPILLFFVQKGTEALQMMRRFFENNIEKVKDFATVFVRGMETIGEGLGKVIDTLIVLGEGLYWVLTYDEILDDFGNRISEMWGVNVTGAINFVIEVIAILNDRFTKLADYIRDNLIPTIQNIVTKITTALAPTFEAIATFVKNTLMPIFADLSLWFVEDALPAITVLAEKVGEFLADYIAPLINFLVRNGLPILGEVLQIVIDVAKKGFEVLILAIGGAIDFVANFIEGSKVLWSFGSTLVENMLSGLSDLGSKIWEAIKVAWEWVQQQVRDNLPKIQLPTINLPTMEDLNPFARGNVLDFRALGGPVTSGSPYIVGEQGPELFVPNDSGSIVPNHEMGGSGLRIDNVNINNMMDFSFFKRELSMAVR